MDLTDLLPVEQLKSMWEFIKQLIDDIPALMKKDKSYRFRVAQGVFDRTMLIHNDYVKLIVTFKEAIRDIKYHSTPPVSNLRDFQRNFSQEAVEKAKKDYQEARKDRAVDRGEVKSYAGASLKSLSDEHEAKFYNAIFYFFQYSDCIGHDLIFDHQIVWEGDGNEKDALQRWATASAWLGSQVRGLDDPDEILSKIQEAESSISNRFGSVLRAFSGLRTNWGIYPTPLSED